MVCVVNNRKGFTLIEVIVILAVIAILAAIAIPPTLRIFQITAEEGTREEMSNLREAMIGNPRKLQSTFRSDFGFLGDIGCLPANLDRILTQGALPAFSFDTTLQAGAGWKGPYITGAAVGEEPEDFKNDQLGNPYTYTPAAGPCPLTATLTSNGPDGAFSTSDDITIALLSVETTGTIRGTVKDTGGNGLAGASVILNFPSNGSLSTVTATADANGNYAFTSVPFGRPSVTAVNTGLSIVPGSITTTGVANHFVDFQLSNSSTTSVQVTGLTVTCPPTVTDWARIQFDNQNADPGGEELCGVNTPLSGSNTNFSANPTSPAPLRVVLDSPDTQVPDLTIGGGGQTRNIELDDFEVGGGNFDMRGQTLTLMFTLAVGGPAVFTFTVP